MPVLGDQGAVHVNCRAVVLVRGRSVYVVFGVLEGGLAGKGWLKDHRVHEFVGEGKVQFLYRLCLGGDWDVNFGASLREFGGVHEFVKLLFIEL